MRTRTSIVSILVAGLLATSAITATAQTEEGLTSASAGCDGPLVEPGVHEGIHDVDGSALAYRVVVPDGAPAPLILKLAADGGGLDIAFRQWHPYLDEAESVFVVAEQQGAFTREPETLVALIDELIAGYCIDQTRVHAMGASSST